LLYQNTMKPLNQNKMEQTAVKWLEMQMASKIADASIRISAVKFYDLINQAKEMEAKQRKYDYLQGIKNYDPTFKQ